MTSWNARSYDRPMMTSAFTYDRATVVMSTECALHKHRELVPTADHHVWPLGDGGPNVPANKKRVCYNGHMSVHSYIDMLRKFKTSKSIGWTVRRRYGRKTRAMAELGWDRIQRRAM